MQASSVKCSFRRGRQVVGREIKYEYKHLNLQRENPGMVFTNYTWFHGGIDRGRLQNYPSTFRRDGCFKRNRSHVMKRIFQILLVLLMSVQLIHAQSTKTLSARDIEQQRNDSLILADMIMPLAANDAPDRAVFADDVKTKFGENYVDRSVTKAKIYYYFEKDPVVFSNALVRYTEKYEDKDNCKLQNKNAKMVLKYSQDPKEWKAAQAWAKRAMGKEPGNAGYKETYDALTAKLK